MFFYQPSKYLMMDNYYHSQSSLILIARTNINIIS